jgi:HNH endonuclease
MQYSKKTIALFLKYRTKATDSGCWEWQGGKHKVGYGVSPFWCGGGRYAHRAMYAAVVSEIPKGMYVLHSCDNRLCVNPEHLSLGTHLDNIKDMHANPSCKFSNEQIMQMREARRRMTLSAMTAHFKISETHLLRVLRGEARV